MGQAKPRARILLANAVRLWGGGERFLLDVATGLRRRGWEAVVQAQPHSPLAERASAEGLEVHAVRTRANGAPWTVLPLAAWIRRRRIDVVLTNFDKDLRTTGLAARLAGLTGIGPPVVHSLECDEPLKRRWYLPLLYRRLSDHLLFNSEATRRTVLSSAPWMASLEHSVLPKGIDVEGWGAVDPPPVLHGLREEIRLGFLGQLVERKELAALLRALAQLEGAGRRWSLRVAGTGPRKATWHALADALGIGQRVRFDGFVPDVPRWMADVDVLVHPSRQEGWGYAVAEAMAAGRVVIARASSSVPELLGPGAPGLYDGDRPGALGEQLRRVLATPPESLRVEAAANQHRARAELTLDRMLDSLETRLERTLHARGKGRP